VVEEVCRKMGISEAIFYNSKKKYGLLVQFKPWGLDNWKRKT
jgi:hypothetical protein